LPSLTQVYERGATSVPSVVVLEGYKNCAASLQEFLLDDFVWINGLPSQLPVGMRNLFHHFHTECKNKKIPFRVIADEKCTTELSDVRYLRGMESYATIILSDKQLLIIQWEKQPLLIQITHPAVILSYKNAFEIMYGFSVPLLS
jgi:hypothetical protein